jgi:hypothetical protein
LEILTRDFTINLKGNFDFFLDVVDSSYIYFSRNSRWHYSTHQSLLGALTVWHEKFGEEVYQKTYESVRDEVGEYSGYIETSFEEAPYEFTSLVSIDGRESPEYHILAPVLQGEATAYIVLMRSYLESDIAEARHMIENLDLKIQGTANPMLDLHTSKIDDRCLGDRFAQLIYLRDVNLGGSQ